MFLSWLKSTVFIKRLHTRTLRFLSLFLNKDLLESKPTNGKYSFRFSDKEIREFSGTKDLSDRFCHNPFNHSEIHFDGKLFACCPTWLPTSIGSLESASFEDAWNSAAAKKIRTSILDGSFKYCSQIHCPHISADSLPLRSSLDPNYLAKLKDGLSGGSRPVSYMLCYDASCNLSCPSCRIKKIVVHSNTDEFVKINNINEKVFSYLFSKPTDRHFILDITGSGDPFASITFMNFISRLPQDGFPNMEVRFQTNGVLLDQNMWKRVAPAHKYLKQIRISVDATTEDVYKEIRCGGDWKKLISNLNFLSSIKNTHGFGFNLNFVVQQKNYFQMQDFIRLAKSLNVDGVQFFLLTDWGTWKNFADYSANCVWSKKHPEYSNFINHLNDPIFDDPIVLPSDFYLYRNKKTSVSVLPN